jgi:hypothetical protein
VAGNTAERRWHARAEQGAEKRGYNNTYKNHIRKNDICKIDGEISASKNGRKKRKSLFAPRSDRSGGRASAF